MIVKKEKTAPNVSVGADTEQSIQKCIDNIITDYDENIKDLDESFREMQREMLWVQKMNNIRNRATEIVNSELIYTV